MDKVVLWKTILGELELEITKPTFKTFFAPTQLRQIEDNVATIGCPNQIIANSIETRYYNLIKQRLDHLLGKNLSLLFTVDKPVTNKKEKESLPLFSKETREETLGTLIRQARLNPLYNFENFAVSVDNQMAYAASTAVAKNPGTSYNPLFLWGGVGVGKTHLMHSIGQSIIARKPRLKVIYCMGEEFTNEIVYAIQTKTTRQFKQKYRTAKVLLIDDVQFIAGKNAVQEEFFHTFNSIHREGGQIVLISDRPPHEIAKLEDRMRSRFEGGLTIDISPPGFELRCAILRIKAQQRGVNLPMDVAQLIAANITGTRRLEGNLIRLLTEAETKKLPLTVELAQQSLGKSEREQKRKVTFTPKKVMEILCQYFDVSLSQLKGSKRKKYIVLPRQVLMYLLRTELQLNLDEIGEFLGGRDHTTIMYGVDKITKEMLINEGLREDVNGIRQRLV